MSWPQILGDLAYRAAWLVGLAIAPPFVEPEPPPLAKLAVGAVAFILLLAAVVYGALRMRAAHAGRGGFAAPALIVAALIAAVACAAIFRGPRAPLARGLLLVAVPLWAGLAVAAGSVARGRLGPRAAFAASLLVAALAVALLGASARWILSPEKMWARSLHSGDDHSAIDGMTRDALRAHDYQGAVAALDRCLEANPRACGCHAGRAEVRTQVPNADRATLDGAIADARAALATCPNGRSVRATLALALTLRGDSAEAEKEARDALNDEPRSARLHYVLALALDRQGRSLEALAEAQQAADLGEGRDAAELFGAIVRALGDLGGAERALDPLAGDKTDAPVLYGRAIVAERLKDDKKAREMYLATLLADPTFADARYNLVVLCLRQGGNPREAKFHARKFASAFPQDPRNADLERMIAAASPTP